MAGKANKLIFANSEKARDAITVEQQKEIAKLYEEWAKDLKARAKYYYNKKTNSSTLSERQAKELMKALEEQSKQVSNEIYTGIKSSIYTVSDSVVKDNVKWLQDLGYSAEGLNAAYSSVPDNIVKMLVTGQIYEGGWNLSSRIWGNNEATLKDCYQIVAKGMAENLPIYDIAKELEKYVSPQTAKSWNPIIRMKNTKTGKWENKRIYRGKVDYNAQRLARTLVQHGYQQSFIAVTEKNPFVLKYQWSSNGSRPCPLCQDRDGQFFEKGDLPMDHPNGMCTMIPVVDDNVVDKLANWFNSPDGTYPEIDEFSKNFGYEPKSITSATKNTQGETASAVLPKVVQDFVDKHGTLPENFKDFWTELDYDTKEQFLENAGTKFGEPWKAKAEEAYEKYKTVMFGGNTLSDSNQVMTVASKSIESVAVKTNNKKMDDASEDSHKQWIRKMGQQTVNAMLQTEEEQFAKMTKSQKEGIRIYSGSSYNQMNSYLRNKAAGNSEEEAKQKSRISDGQLEALKNAKNGLKKAALTQETYLRRGTDLGDLAGFMPGNFKRNLNKLNNMSIEELKNVFVGTTGTYAGFTSTSSLYDKGFIGDVEIIFKAPKGTQASSIMSISQYGTAEGETLLNAGTNVKIIDVEESDGHKGSSIRVFMEIINE